ncbi:hypothetical protein JOF28_001747 [Leucobacter exalbidus]|uniref:HNH nuclease domain-containing protein n=1 Tax=Leucobacter exalbidus TaxID=662960 RepID=A0A940PNX4_9MICO|nr:HNH endonuclease signature motif containing protein [Leucobacter exalbidus]MBP1326515.1 hypothetical protein [Leucobacter exalbidus]
MKFSLLEPPTELLAALDNVVSGIQAVRAQISSLQAAEALLLQAGSTIAEGIAQCIPHGVQSGRSLAKSQAMAYRMVHTDIGAAVHESDRTVAAKMERATDLITDYPGTYRALAAGRVSEGHVRAIVDAGVIITDAKRREKYEREALQLAEAETVGRVRPIVKELAERCAEVTIDERHERACAGRNVMVIDREDGMADLIAHLPAALAHGIKDKVDQLSHHIIANRNTETFGDTAGKGGAGGEAAAPEDGVSESGETRSPEIVDTRTTDQVRADLLCDMLLVSDPLKTMTTGTPMGGITARVQVIVPITRLTGTATGTATEEATGATTGTATEDTAGSDRGHPASLAGYGPIDTDTAKDLACATSSWEQVKVDAETGTIITVDTYRPSAELRRFLGARDQHCRFFGCRMPLRKCDIDHTIDAALGGATSSDNLGHICRRHHTLKHATPWEVIQDQNGVYTWTSPTGRKYEDIPESAVRFRPDPPGEGTGGPETPDGPSPDRPPGAGQSPSTEATEATEATEITEVAERPPVERVSAESVWGPGWDKPFVPRIGAKCMANDSTERDSTENYSTQSDSIKSHPSENDPADSPPDWCDDEPF